MLRIWRANAIAVMIFIIGAGSADLFRDLIRPSPSADPFSTENLLGKDPVFTTVHVPRLGSVTGIHVGEVTKFLGIPYARPPVGQLRWSPPQPFGPWEGGRLNATKFGASCPSAIATGSWIRAEDEDEDCLFLNVVVPRRELEQLQGRPQHLQHSTGASKLPCVIWLHGGGFIMGSGSNPSTSPPPDKLVDNGRIIFVSLNYRLGALGSLSSSAMDSGGGMFSILDQQAAMTWVANHIAAFGGDPSRVTVRERFYSAAICCTFL